MKLNDVQKHFIEKYRECFNNTGGNDIIELMEREGVNFFNNVPAACLQACCWSQLFLLQNLDSKNLLVIK